MKLESKAFIQIQKPAEQVFEAIVDPEKMTKYFISESSGKLETGKDVIWKFPEFDDRFPITQVKVDTYRSIAFVWDPQTIVHISLEELPDKSTIVRVKEGSKEITDENIKWALENSGGWANFLACLKAYLEYDIALRKGAFDFMRKS